MFQLCSTPPRNILNAEHTTSKYFKRAANPRNVSNVQHTTLKKLRRAAHHLEIFSDQIREYVPNDLSFAVAWALTLYRCRGNYWVRYCMGCFCLFGRGMLMSLCRGGCPPGHIHAVIYKQLNLHSQYTPSLLVAYSALALWKGLGVVGDGNFGLVAMADVTTVLSIPTLQSLHSPWTHQRKPTYVRICECGLLAGYHNLRKSIRTFKNRLLYMPLGYSTDWTPPLRHCTELHLAAAQLAALPHVV